jgi:hypothetical protein
VKKVDEAQAISRADLIASHKDLASHHEKMAKQASKWAKKDPKWAGVAAGHARRAKIFGKLAEDAAAGPDPGPISEAKRGRKPAAPTDDSDTDQHILHQLKKASVLRGQHTVSFKNGDRYRVPPDEAQKALVGLSSRRTPDEKEHFISRLWKSKDSFGSAVAEERLKPKNT